MTPFHFRSSIIPDSFFFPKEYLDLSNSNALPPMPPWQWLDKNMPLALSFYSNLLIKFPEKPLIPFATIHDLSGVYNDGYIIVACFNGLNQSRNPEVMIYDYGNPKKMPWDNLVYDDFQSWFNAAQQESILYIENYSE